MPTYEQLLSTWALIGMTAGLDSSFQSFFWPLAAAGLVFAFLSDQTTFFDRPLFGSYEILPNELSGFHMLMTLVTSFSRVAIGSTIAHSGFPYMYLVWGGVFVGGPRLVTVFLSANDRKATGNTAITWVACFADISTLHFILTLESEVHYARSLQVVFLCLHCAQWVPCLAAILGGEVGILHVTQGLSDRGSKHPAFEALTYAHALTRLCSCICAKVPLAPQHATGTLGHCWRR